MRLLLIISIFIAWPAMAEIWTCENGLFMDRAAAGCKVLDPSVACGKNGNKYISPLTGFLEPSDQHCAKSEKHTSPMVSLQKVKHQKEAAVKQRSDKPLTKNNQGKTYDSPLMNMPVVQHLISEYKKIWGRYDELLPED